MADPVGVRPARRGSVEVSIRAIAAGGAGVGDLPDGRVVFVPRTAPGDRASIHLEKEKARWAAGALDGLVEPGPNRAEAPCRLYATCGGCQLQHLEYDEQLRWKRRFVSDALTRLGGLEDVEPPEVVPSPARLRYRNRVSVTLRRLRSGRVVAGFHALARPSRIVDLGDECLLPEEPIHEAWCALRAGWGAGARLLPGGGQLRLTLRSGGSGPELLIEGGRAGWWAGPLREAVPSLTSVRHRPAASGDRAGGAPEAGMSGGGFEQVNEGAAGLLREHVAAVAGAGGTAVDAYCGSGAFARDLALAGWSVVGIESDADAIAAAEPAPGLTYVAGRVEDALAQHLPADLLVVNPPRTGLHRDVPGIVLASAPARIVYVSCDPATLARDLRALSGGYGLVGLRAFDLFPQTAHVETVAELALRGTRP